MAMAKIPVSRCVRTPVEHAVAILEMSLENHERSAPTDPVRRLQRLGTHRRRQATLRDTSSFSCGVRLRAPSPTFEQGITAAAHA